MQNHKPQKAKGVLNRNNNAEAITISDFKLYCRTVAKPDAGTKNNIQTSGAQKGTPKINPHSCGHIIFNKGATNTLGKESAGKSEHPPAEDWGESCVSQLTKQSFQM